MLKASKLSVYLMALLYIAAGVNHFVHPAFYEKMIANFLPDTDLIVKMSGLAEIALGLLLLFPKTRRIGAYGIILLLIAVFPANINMALHPQQWQISPLILLARLLLQFVLIYWAYQISKAAKPLSA
jgi:uncharacterized membrane protein